MFPLDFLTFYIYSHFAISFSSILHIFLFSVFLFRLLLYVARIPLESEFVSPSLETGLSLLQFHQLSMTEYCNRLLQLCTARTVFSIIGHCAVTHSDAGDVSLVDQ